MQPERKFYPSSTDILKNLAELHNLFFPIFKKTEGVWETDPEERKRVFPGFEVPNWLSWAVVQGMENHGLTPKGDSPCEQLSYCFGDLILNRGSEVHTIMLPDRISYVLQISGAESVIRNVENHNLLFVRENSQFNIRVTPDQIVFACDIPFIHLATTPNSEGTNTAFRLDTFLNARLEQVPQPVLRSITGHFLQKILSHLEARNHTL